MNSEMQYRDERALQADSNHRQRRSVGAEPVFRQKKEMETKIKKTYAPHDMYVMYAELSEPQRQHASMHRSQQFPSREMQLVRTGRMIKWEFLVGTAIFLGTRDIDIIGESDQKLAHFWATEGNGVRGEKTVSVALSLLPQGF